MIERRNVTMLPEEEPTKEPPIKVAKPLKQPPISHWLSQLEEKIAADFRRRTGLDYKATVGQIVDAAEPYPGMQVLDVATGTGVIARQFVGRIGEKGKIIAIDATKEKVEQASLTAQSAGVSRRIECRVMSLEKLGFPERSFDLVTCAMAFHRLNAERFLAEAYRVLKPGGRLIIADELAPRSGASTLRLSVRRNYYRYIVRDQIEADAHFYTSEEALEMLAAAGFTRFMVRGLRQRSKRDRVFSLIKAMK